MMTKSARNGDKMSKKLPRTPQEMVTYKAMSGDDSLPARFTANESPKRPEIGFTPLRAKYSTRVVISPCRVSKNCPRGKKT